jgi:hypothetical protein
MAVTLASPATSRSAHAGVVAGVAMPDTVRFEQQLFLLQGAAVYSKFGVQVLVAGLWLDHRESDAAKILDLDLPRRYVTHFLRRVGGKRIRDAWMKGLQANTPGATAEVREQFRTLCSWTRDFVAGEEITVTYIPGRGSLVEIGGVRKGILPGKGFADTYFACAIGPKPGLGEKFKRHLLGS